MTMKIFRKKYIKNLEILKSVSTFVIAKANNIIIFMGHCPGGEIGRRASFRF